MASKNGFLKSIGGDFAPILNGPFGWGALPNPIKVHRYSPESAELTINWHWDSNKVDG